MYHSISKKIVIVSCIICIFLLLIFIRSYSFFINQLGETHNEEINTTTATLALIFSDGNMGFSKSLNFGETAVKTFTIENTGTLESFVNLNFENLINTYTHNSLTFTLSYSETENGEYQTIVMDRNIFTSDSPIKQVIVSNLKIPSKTKYFYKLDITLNYLENINQTDDLQATFSTNFSISEGKENIVKKIKASAHPENEQPNFSIAATTDEGVYQTTDDYGTSYYFRGAVKNNYVKFAGFYWRIIRVNGDGTLRIIYDGTEAHSNEDTSNDRVISNSAYNIGNSDAKYVGYMYGPAGTQNSTSKSMAQSNIEDSNIKKVIDSWYENNIPMEMRNFLADEIFCNDRSTAPSAGIWYKISSEQDTALGYGKNLTIYGGWQRTRNVNDSWKTSLSLTLKCSQKNDAFTVQDTNLGNGSLKYPIATITSDEVFFAGNRGDNNNTKYYLFRNIRFWTMTPFDVAHGISTVFTSNLNEFYSTNNVSSNYSVLPVINLSQEFIESMVGSGTMEDPYIGINERTI